VKNLLASASPILFVLFTGTCLGGPQSPGGSEKEASASAYAQVRATPETSPMRATRATPAIPSAPATPATSAIPATPEIPGVVKAGTPIQLVKDGFEAVEGPLPQSDDGLLFTNNRVGRIVHIGTDDSVSVWYEGAGGANALTRTPKGDVVATLTENLAIGVVRPGEAPRVLVGDYEGTPFNRPNDVVANRRGDIYFTDTVSITATKPPAMPSAVYQLTSGGKLTRIANDIARPNGVALSPDDRTLYVANTTGEWVLAFGLDRNGLVKDRRDFARLALPSPPPSPTASPTSSPTSSPAPSASSSPAPNAASAGAGADGLATDDAGRLYVATALGVQVFSPKGKPLGILTLPKQPQNLAFSGPGRSTLYVVGRGAVYRIKTLTRGPRRPGK
jgi:gluconolactonase